MWPRRTVLQWSKSLNGACIEISSLFFWVKCIKHHSLDEMFICWNGVAYKVLIKKRSVMNHFYCVLFPTACAEYSQFQRDWRSTNDPCPFPIHLRCSFCVWNATNYSPVGSTLFQSLAKLRGVIWGTLPGTLGVNDLPELPLLIPVVDATLGNELSLLIITSTSHQWHRRWIIPVNPYPWCREAMFVYIDLQHMWHSCCRQRLELAEVCSRSPLATVQLAGKIASSTHLTNQYKQWSSKSRIMLECSRQKGGGGG